jgi:hypothetical protein
MIAARHQLPVVDIMKSVLRAALIIILPVRQTSGYQEGEQSCGKRLKADPARCPATLPDPRAAQGG